MNQRFSHTAACLLLGLALSAPWCPLSARPRYDRALLARVMSYRQQFDQQSVVAEEENVYSRFRLRIAKRNFTLMGIPSIHRIAREHQRTFMGEAYDHYVPKDGRLTGRRQVEVTTVRGNRSTLPMLSTYAAPNIYNDLLFSDRILSPLHQSNRKYYRYRTIATQQEGIVRLLVRPKLKNTQLVAGDFYVERATGRVISFDLDGEYDMISFRLHGEMNSKGVLSLKPSMCRVDASIHVLGNHLLTRIATYYHQPITLPDSIDNSHSRLLMAQLRPVTLDSADVAITARFDSALVARQRSEDSIRQANGGVLPPKKRSWAKRVLWDLVGDNVLNRIHDDLGGKGQFRFGPIFNPLYMGYSRRKGIVYKLDMRLNYDFTPNRGVSLRWKGGYSFRQRQWYFRLPLEWQFNRRRNGKLFVEFGNGNRIFNAEVLRTVRKEARDSIRWDNVDLNYFRDARFSLGTTIDIVPHRLTAEGGLVAHRRSAVQRAVFKELGQKPSYRSVAPYLELTVRPWGEQGARMTVSYERSPENFCKSDVSYERWEFDITHVRRLPRMRSWTLRGGAGLYTDRSKNDFFLDYTNFRENYLPSGWDDDWSGEFELLRSEWYNASDYYLRFNSTYSSPLMLLAWLPVVGSVVEKEQIYLSALAIRKYAPYLEAGYAFTNRVFSCGVFGAWSRQGFEGMGVKFGFELFNNW